MNQCLSEQALLQCYSGEGAADELAHVKSCLACAARYRELESDMGLIMQALQAPPPRRERSTTWGFARWRVAASAAAVAVAFAVGWSLRGASLSPFAGGSASVALRAHAPIGAPMQVSALEPTPAIYAAYVQDEFGGDSCSETSDPLAPGCL
jgi:hypothetical protein